MRIASYVRRHAAASVDQFRSSRKLHYVTGRSGSSGVAAAAPLFHSFFLFAAAHHNDGGSGGGDGGGGVGGGGGVTAWCRGGLGNQLNSMMSLLLAAMYTGGGSSGQHIFLASFDNADADCSGCTSARVRYDGMWAAVFNGLSVELEVEERENGWIVLRDINAALHSLWCWNVSDSSSSMRVHASQILPTLMRSSSLFGAAIDSDFGPPPSSPLMFYLSRLLLVPRPALKMETAAVVAALRHGGAWVVGVQMRWIANGRQYMLPADMTAFVCACVAAAHSERLTRFYIASDSVAAEQLLVQRLLLQNSSWQITLSHASSNTSDGDTDDAIIDLTVLSECDDLIVTHHSSYALLAASLSGLRPIVVGAHLSASYGVCNPQRAVREDSVVFSNMRQPSSLVMQQVQWKCSAV